MYVFQCQGTKPQNEWLMIKLSCFIAANWLLHEKLICSTLSFEVLLHKCTNVCIFIGGIVSKKSYTTIEYPVFLVDSFTS